MDTSVLRERIELETTVCKDQSQTNFVIGNFRYRNLDLTFSSEESDDEPLTSQSVPQLLQSEVHDQELDLRPRDQQPRPWRLERSRTQQVIEEIESQQFDDAD